MICILAIDAGALSEGNLLITALLHDRHLSMKWKSGFSLSDVNYDLLLATPRKEKKTKPKRVFNPYNAIVEPVDIALGGMRKTITMDNHEGCKDMN